MELNVYAIPAIITLVLLTAETIFLIVALPETRGKGPILTAEEKGKAKASATQTPNGKTNGTSVLSRKASVDKRIGLLKSLRRFHFLFLGIFSGVEFTLTFLTFDRKFCYVFIEPQY